MPYVNPYVQSRELIAQCKYPQQHRMEYIQSRIDIFNIINNKKNSTDFWVNSAYVYIAKARPLYVKWVLRYSALGPNDLKEFLY